MIGNLTANVLNENIKLSKIYQSIKQYQINWLSNQRMLNSLRERVLGFGEITRGL